MEGLGVIHGLITDNVCGNGVRVHVSVKDESIEGTFSKNGIESSVSEEEVIFVVDEVCIVVRNYGGLTNGLNY